MKRMDCFILKNDEGQIPLFLNDQAIAFASTSIGEKLYYGITSFSVTQKQTVSLKIKEGNKRQLSQAFQDMKLDGIELDIITKKRIISPSPCTSGSDSDTTLNTTSSL
jgi:hypothetical protein